VWCDIEGLLAGKKKEYIRVRTAATVQTTLLQVEKTLYLIKIAAWLDGLFRMSSIDYFLLCPKKSFWNCVSATMAPKGEVTFPP
jgi:hypothetical protein